MGRPRRRKGGGDRPGTGAGGAPPAAAAPAASTFCSFYVGAERYGLEVDRVREVIRHGPPSPVPLAPPEVVGLINLRGRICTVLDLRARLGRPPTVHGERFLGLVLGGPRGLVSLLIDRPGDVLTVDPQSFEPPPETVPAPVRALLRGTYKLADGLLLVLDGDRAVPDVDAR